MNPIDYFVEAPPPSVDAFTFGRRQFMVEEAARQKALVAEEAARQKAARQAELETELDGLGDDPSPQRLARLVLRFPELRESAVQAHEMLKPGQQRALVGAVSGIYAALLSGRPDVAKQRISEQIAAYQNVGDEEEVAQLESLLAQVGQDPITAMNELGLYLASVDDNFAKNVETLEGLRRAAAGEQREVDLHPSALRQAIADADKAVADARKAVSEADTWDERQRADLALKNAELDLTRARTVQTQTTTAATRATATRTAAEAAAPAEGEPSAIPQPVPLLTQPVHGALAVGVRGFMGKNINTIVDALGGRLPFPRLEEASQALTNLNVQTVTLLQDAVPGRPSNLLMQKLEELAVRPASLFMGDERAKIRLTQTRNMLKQEVDRIEREILRNPQLYTQSQLSASRNSFGQLQQLVQEYDQIISAFRGRNVREQRPTNNRNVVVDF